MKKLRDNKGMGVIEMILMTTMIVVLLLIMASTLTGCVSAPSDMTYKGADGEDHKSINTYYVQDPDTGVYYVIYSGGYGGGICPRYNADGTLYTGE